jgi:prepilin-type processing-associated H-X9-DG protein
LAYNLRGCKAPTCNLSRSDYAANSGNLLGGEEAGPGSYGAAANYDWSFDSEGNIKSWLNGISYQRSQVRIPQITDGTSSTALIGERYIASDKYFNGTDPADDQNIFVAHDRDMNRYTALGTVNTSGSPNLPVPATLIRLPLPDRPGFESDGRYFGSAHPNGINMVFCDNSVRFFSFSVDPETWRLFGGRDDEIAGPAE